MTDDHSKPSGWNGAELQALLLAILAVVVWGGSWALFGFAGLIIPALLLVVTMFCVLVLISLG